MSGTVPTPVDPRPASADRVQLEQAVQLALRAPSVHNTQPWRWGIRDSEIDLYADPDRHLPGTDPDRRDLLISCGAALHHLRVALAGNGLGSRTRLLPDPDDHDLLATVRVVSDRPDPADAALLPALTRRRTDRRPYTAGEIPDDLLQALRSHTARLGVRLQPVIGPAARARLETVLAAAADDQRKRPGYVAELLTWTHRYAGAHDGIPASAIPHAAPARSDTRLRFPPGRLASSAGVLPDHGTLVALATSDDDDAARLAAGVATSAVLLEATLRGYATASLSQALELPETRERVARDALHMPEHPQMIIRIGQPPDGTMLPATPRRPLAAVLLGGEHR